MSAFNKIDSFDIDDGELSGLTPAAAFVLGVEWANVRLQLAVDDDEFSVTVHLANEVRLGRLARRHARAISRRHHDGVFVTLTLAKRERS